MSAELKYICKVGNREMFMVVAPPQSEEYDDTCMNTSESGSYTDPLCKTRREARRKRKVVTVEPHGLGMKDVHGLVEF